MQIKVYSENDGGVLGPAAGLTAGSVLFADSLGDIAQDNDNFLWDDTNNRLGIGIAIPRRRIDVLDTFSPQIRLTFSDNAIYTDLQTTSAGVFTILPTGFKTTIGSATITTSSLFNILGSTKDTLGAIITTADTTPQAAGTGGKISFFGRSDASTTVTSGALFGCEKSNSTAGNTAFDLIFKARRNGLGFLTEYMRFFGNTGNIAMGVVNASASIGRLNLVGYHNFTPYAGATACVATVAGAGGVTAGTHSYAIAFVNSVNGETGRFGIKSNVITAAGGGSTVNLTSIPLGDPGTVTRKVYRTVAGDAGSYLLVSTIDNNTATTYSDTTADGALGAAMSETTNTSAMVDLRASGVRILSGNLSGDARIGNTSGAINSKLEIIGEADKTQLLVRGFTTQTTDLAVFENSAETDVVTISNAGDVTLAGDLLLPSGGAVNFDSGDISLTHSSNVLSMTGGALFQQATDLMSGSIYQSRYSANIFASNQFFRKSRGTTIGAHAILVDGDSVHLMRYYGSDGAAFVEGARLEVNVDGSPASGDVPMEFRWATQTDGGALSYKMQLTSGGNLGVGAIDPTVRLQVNGGRIQSVRAISAVNANSAITDNIVTFDSTLTAISYVLQSSDVANGRVIYFKDTAGTAAGNNITISTQGAELIDGAATYVINTNYGSVQLFCNGTNWFTI